ncbi:hypothetical protein TNCV_1746981 [Trichonephila clavipes]|nr:hypothetical protein TNCV_1746981 [Trichonephila clavipes]
MHWTVLKLLALPGSQKFLAFVKGNASVEDAKKNRAVTFFSEGVSSSIIHLEKALWSHSLAKCTKNAAYVTIREKEQLPLRIDYSCLQQQHFLAHSGYYL